MRYKSDAQRRAVMAKLRGTEAVRPSNIKEICAGERGERKVANNTRVYRDRDGTCKLRLHRTDVATIDPNTGNVKLDSGGWQTTTTKQRLSGVLDGTGYHVIQKDYRWYVQGPDGTKRPYEDGMIINTDTYKASRDT